MRILQIINGLGTGGAEKLLIDTAPILIEKGNKVDVLLLNGQQTPFYKQLILTTRCNIFVLGKSFYNPLYIFKIGKYLSKYDVIHVHLFPAQYFTVVAKILFFSKAKLVFTEHSTTNTRLANPAFKFVERFIYHYYSKIICITPQVKAALLTKLNIPEKKLVVIENGINLCAIEMAQTADRNAFGYHKEDVLLVMVAGFRKEKDQDTVIKALQNLPMKFHLLLVGDGARRGELTDLVANLALSNRVNFLGVRDDVHQLVKMADIAILSSHFEGFGLAAAEAMAAGTPVLASNVAGLAQVVANGGILFERGNDLELSSKILSLCDDISLRKKTASMGVEKSKLYDIELMVDKSIACYKEILNG